MGLNRSSWPVSESQWNHSNQCCVVGGGPAGMMLGYLLARAGVDVMVLEKHADFFRDFRGDTVHPSTLEVMHELGLLEDFLKVPHQRANVRLAPWWAISLSSAADFTHLPTRCKFVALMPQWDFLNFLSDRAKRFPCFQLRMQCEGVDLIRDGAAIVGRGSAIAGGAGRRSRPTWWWHATAGIQRYGKRRVSRCRSSACRSMCSGFTFRAGRAIPSRCWATSTTEER